MDFLIYADDTDLAHVSGTPLGRCLCQAILPVAPVKLKELFSINYFQVGLFMAVLNISSSVIQPVFGYISDRFPTGWFVPVGVLWSSLAMGLLGWSINYPVAVLLVGLASGLILGLVFGTGGVGSAFSGFLADKLGLYPVLWILALAPVLGAVLAAFIRTGGTETQAV